MSFNNPYVHGNWAGIKMMKKSTGDNKHAPGDACSPRNNTPTLNQQSAKEQSGGMATPNAGPATC